jgi:hypothetical protein
MIWFNTSIISKILQRFTAKNSSGHRYMYALRISQHMMRFSEPSSVILKNKNEEHIQNLSIEIQRLRSTDESNT